MFCKILFDLFEKGYHKYSFIPKCREDEELELKDGTDRIFICAGGDKDDVSEEMRCFIDYLTGSVAKSDLTARIESKVKEAIEKRLWRKEYMTYKEQMNQEYKRGKAEGEEERKALKNENELLRKEIEQLKKQLDK